MPRVSIVTTLFRSEPYIREFYERGRAALEHVTDDYEFVFVDDGSPDGSAESVLALIADDKNVRLIELSRNFGHHRALMAGLEHTSGDLVFLLDSDLEEEPELLTKFYDVMRANEETDVVFGYMERRKGDAFERLSGWLFYKIINFMSEIHIPESVLAARLMTRRYVDQLVRYREVNVFFGGVSQLAGFKQIGVPCTKGSKGNSSYTLSMKIAQLLDAILSFTNKPLTYVAGSGLTIAVLSFFAALYLLVAAASTGRAISGWTVVLAAQGIIGGLTIASIGLVGFYVGRIFLQVKDRPTVVIKAIHNPDRRGER